MAYDIKNVNFKTEEVDLGLTYALDNLEIVRSLKLNDLREKFFISRPSPKTWEEAFKWYNEGYFVVAHDATPETVKSRYHGGFFDYVQWGNKKPDQEGFAKASSTLATAYTAAEDIIALSDNAARLKALQDFRSYTIH